MKQGLLIVLASALIAGVGIKAAPAVAETARNLNVSYVGTADLDLSTAAGRRQLDHRLTIAAREVCGVASDVDLEGKNDVRKCRVETLANARARGDSLIAAADRSATIAIAAAR